MILLQSCASRWITWMVCFPSFLRRTLHVDYFFSVEVLRTYAIPEEKSDYMIPSGETAETDMDVDVNIDPQLKESPRSQSTSGPPLKSNLRLFPPPLFSRQTIPQAYKFVLFSLSHYCKVISGRQFQIQYCIDGINYCR